MFSIWTHRPVTHSVGAGSVKTFVNDGTPVSVVRGWMRGDSCRNRRNCRDPQGTDRQKLDSSFRLAFPTTLQSPAMHTDDTVWPGPTRSYLTPGTKGTSVFISISREVFEMKTRFTTTISFTECYRSNCFPLCCCEYRHIEGIIRSGNCMACDRTAEALKWAYRHVRGYWFPKYAYVSSH